MYKLSSGMLVYILLFYILHFIFRNHEPQIIFVNEKLIVQSNKFSAVVTDLFYITRHDSVYFEGGGDYWNLVIFLNSPVIKFTYRLILFN